jgi:hypothetical protein
MPIKDESQQQSSGRQHPIPQNVMDVEFKVVGDLTVRQLMYLFAGGIFAYIIYRSELPGFWRIIILFITIVITIAIAFIPYEERGLDKWLMSFLKAMTMPTQMVWRKTYSPPAYFLSDYANIIKNEIITLTPAKSRNKLDDYLGQLSESENELDKVEAMRLQNIRMGFSNQAGTSVMMQQTTTSSYSPSLGGTTTTTETQVVYADEPVSPGRSFSDSQDDDNNVKDTENPLDRKSLPDTKPVQQQEQSQPTLEPEKPPVEQTQIKAETEEPKPPVPQEKPAQQPVQQETIGRQQLQQKPQAQPQPQQQITPKPPISPEHKAALVSMKEDEVSSKKELLNSIEFKKPTLAAPSIDRAIINIPSSPNGEIKIRTTTKLPRTIVVQDIKEIQTKEALLEKKISELLDVATQVRTEAQNAADKEAHLNKNKGRIEYFDTKYQELEKERARITSELDESTGQVKQIAPTEGTDLNKQVSDLSIKNEELKAQLEQIQAEIVAIRSAPQQPAAAQPAPSEPQPQMNRNSEQAQSLSQETTQDTPKQQAASKASPQESNLITGVVKSKTGDLIDSAVVIIKDKDGDAIRALKTNQLGQFRTQTAMQNGKYTVEVIKGGMKFDIISVEAKGQPISPLSIIAFE